MSAQPAIVPGTEVDGFAIGELFHAGPLARIYRVSGRDLRARALMKVPTTAAGEGASGMLGFETEARVLGALSGPHVPRLLAVGELVREPYLVMEWIEGESLEARRRRGPLPVAEVAALGAAVADALHSVHLQGAIHLDLKPDNVILRPDGSAVLVDFGMAHHARFPDLLAEESRFAAGSAPYVSPEQVGGDRADTRSDLFALGALLYELSTGKLPFGSPATLAGLRDRLWLDPRPLRELDAGLPGWLQEIVLRCLEPDAGNRYQSAAHVAFDLRHPHTVALTARAAKVKRAALLQHLARWWGARMRAAALRPPRRRAQNSPVVMVAVDTMHPDDERHPALVEATARLLSLAPEFRLICVSVVNGEPVGGGTGPGIHVQHLVRLRHWVRPLGVPEARLSLHVIESLSPSSALLEFARGNNVDLIVIGAPDPSQQALAWWRSVASSVTANAPCSVHVVRVPGPR
jgi:nucleotide-binding universal stress UspA family protein